MNDVFGGIGGNLIKKLSDSLFKGLNKLFEQGVEIGDINKESDDSGSDVLKLTVKTGGGNTLKVKMTRLKDDRWDMLVQGRDGKKTEVQNITPDKADDKLTDIIDDWYGESYEGLDDTEDLFAGEPDDDESDDVEESTKIGLTFRSVKGAVELRHVNCSIDTVKDAANAISSLFADDEFLAEVPEEDTLYEIVPDEESYEVIPLYELEEREQFAPFNEFEIMMCKCQQLIDNLNNVKWSYTDSNVFPLVDIEWSVRNLLDVLAGFSFEVYGYAPNSKCLHCSEGCSIDSYKDGLDKYEAISILTEDVMCLIDAISTLCCNIQPDMQIVLMGYVRDLKQYSRNTLKKQSLS